MASASIATSGDVSKRHRAAANIAIHPNYKPLIHPCTNPVKKGFGGFSNISLDTLLRNMGVTTCVVAWVMTSVCVSSTVRGGVEHNYRTIIVKDAVADVHRENHDAELRILGRVFADVKTIDEVVAMLHNSALRDQGPAAFLLA